MRLKMSWKILMIMLVDTLIMVSSYALALLIRFDFQWSQIPMTYVRSWVPCLVVQLIVTAIVFFWRRMYHYIWRTVNAYDVIRMCVSVILEFALSNLCCMFLNLSLPKSVWVMIFVFQLCGLVGERCALRLWSVRD